MYNCTRIYTINNTCMSRINFVIIIVKDVPIKLNLVAVLSSLDTLVNVSVFVAYFKPLEVCKKRAHLVES